MYLETAASVHKDTQIVVIDPLILFRRQVSPGLLQGDRNLFLMSSAFSATDNTRQIWTDTEKQFNGDVACNILSQLSTKSHKQSYIALLALRFSS